MNNVMIILKIQFIFFTTFKIFILNFFILSRIYSHVIFTFIIILYTHIFYTKIILAFIQDYLNKRRPVRPTIIDYSIIVSKLMKLNCDESSIDYLFY